jgi:molybdenum cofactor synthesis domain-containing protein
LKKIKVENAVGLTLAHDITEVIPGKKKDVAFKRGRVIEAGDIERLLDLGKGHIYVTEGNEKEIHEDEAARRMAIAAMDGNMHIAPAKEGRINIVAKVDGLVTVNRRLLSKMNRITNVLFTTVPDNYTVKAGDLVAATRIIPLYISEEHLTQAEDVARQGIVRILPFIPMKAGLVVTGTEVATGRIVDGSARVEEKLKGYGLEVIGKKLVSDEVELIRDTVMEMVDKGADIIITTGGLSVDPDDLTKEGVEATGAKVICYGAPVFPGAMFLVAQLKGCYILGAPACVYFNTRTVLDVLLPQVMAGKKVSVSMVRNLALGGLCLHCPQCHYPVCFFGKGC